MANLNFPFPEPPWPGEPVIFANSKERQRLALNAVAIATSTSLMLGSQGEIEPRSIRTDREPPWVEVVHNGERYRLVVEKL